MSKIMVAGVPGAGKTTLLEKLRPRLAVPIINFGSAMLEVARSQGFTGTRDDLRAVPSDVANKWRARTCASFPTDCIIDGHLTVQTPTGIRDAMPPELREKGAIDWLVSIYARPETILQRRAHRGRPSGPHESAAVQQHIDENRRVAERGKMESGWALLHIDTSAESAEEAATRVAGALPSRFFPPRSG